MVYKRESERWKGVRLEAHGELPVQDSGRDGGEQESERERMREASTEGEREREALQQRRNRGE